MRRVIGIWVAGAAISVAAVATATSRTPIDPKADAVLRHMSDYLSSLKNFRVDAESIDEVVLPSGEKLEVINDSQVSVKRPNHLRSDRIGPVADVVFRYDGQQLSVYGKRTGMYAIAPAPDDIDHTIDVARDRYGIYAPGADLLYSNPYAVLTEQATEGRYVGIELVGGVPCHHLAVRGQDVDWQIWVQDGPEPLPRRYVITSKNEPGQPKFVLNMSHWEPQANASDQAFVFQPPPGSTRIQFITRGREARR